MRQPSLTYATAGPVEAHATTPLVPGGVAEPAPDTRSSARSDAPILLALVAVAAAEVAALLAWIMAA